MAPDEERPLTSDEAPPDVPELAVDETERVDHTRPVASPPPSSPQAPEQRAAARQRRAASRRREGRAGYAPPPAQPSAPPGTGQMMPYPLAPAPGAVRRPARRTAPANSGFYFPWWSLVMLVVIVGVAALTLFLMFTEMSQPVVPGNQPARVQVVTSQPTLSQDFAQQPGGAAPAPGLGAGPTPIPQSFPTPTVPLPTPIPSPSLPPGDFVIGAQVRVVGVGTNGLNIRSSPGLDGTPRFLAAEDEVFVIVDGPQNVDSLEWWRVEDPDDSERFGWAARNYLEIVTQ